MSSTNPTSFGRLWNWVREDIRAGDNTDLWILLVISVIFTMLGATGLTSAQVLSSVVLSLLAILAISQIRSRLQVRSAAEKIKGDRAALLMPDFPVEHYASRARAVKSYFFAGYSMQRTLPTARPDIERILRSGGSLRVLLPDPASRSLMRMISDVEGDQSPPTMISENIKHTIRQCGDLGRMGDVEVRLTGILPSLGINGIDLNSPQAEIMIQLYEFQPQGEAGPIMLLSRGDGRWFDHFGAEIERLWLAGRPV